MAQHAIHGPGGTLPLLAHGGLDFRRHDSVPAQGQGAFDDGDGAFDADPQTPVEELVSGLFACLDFYFQFPAPARFAEQFVWLPGGVYRRAQGLFYEASTLATEEAVGSNPNN